MLHLLNLTLLFADELFQRGRGAFVIQVENPEGWGVTIAVKNGKSREVGVGGPREIPSVVGIWIFSGTTQWENCGRQSYHDKH